jgi:hypothetical protein
MIAGTGSYTTRRVSTRTTTTTDVQFCLVVQRFQPVHRQSSVGTCRHRHCIRRRTPTGQSTRIVVFTMHANSTNQTTIQQQIKQQFNNNSTTIQQQFNNNSTSVNDIGHSQHSVSAANE